MLKSKPQNLTHYLTWLFFGLAAVSLVVGVYIGWRQHTQNIQTIKWVMAHPVEAPSTAKPSSNEFNNYTVAADLPRYIFIPKLNVAAIVRSLGVTKINEIASPSNVYDAGWFNQSGKPGQPGALVVDGHVSSWTTHGIFYGLKTLKADDTIQIEKGNGTKLSYLVVKTQTYDVNKVDMKAVLSPVEPDHPGLNLITCTGNVIKGTNQFDKRVVVFAKQI